MVGHELGSPDGGWIAFVTTKSEQEEVWVRAAPQSSSGKSGVPFEVQISTNGGDTPRWSRASRELLYRSGDQIMTVSYALEREMLVPSKPRVRVEKLGSSEWDLAPDGRIAVVMPVEPAKAAAAEHTVMFLQNVIDEVRRRLP
jgi:hypothetical protein